MLAKLWAIAQKDITVAFRDRNAMLMMFAMPLALSLIIGAAFGTSGDIAIDEVPVAVINDDTGARVPGGEMLTLGQTIAQAFVPTGDPALDANYAIIHDLTDGERATDLDATRAKVEDGDLAALVAITDPDFSAHALSGDAPATVQVYVDSGRSVGPSVVRSIVNAVTNGMNSVILAQRVGPVALRQVGADLGADEAAINAAVARVSAQSMTIAQSTPVTLEQVDLQGETRSFDALQYFAPSMAIFFMTFAMAAGATGILTEARNWTLQRVITTPTPRWVFMGGKLAGTYLTGVVQMTVLIVSTSLLALLMGREGSVWGTNLVGLVLMVLAVVFAATAIGLTIAAVAESPDQASTYSTVALVVLGTLGGSFLPIEGLPDAISWLPKITLNYWGIQGFFALAYDNAPLADIAPNLLALLVIGAAFVAISLGLFNRRVDMGG